MADSLPKVAVVTGGHSYDVTNFHKLFRALEGLEVYIQHMDDFASSPEPVRDGYDAAVFYIMLREGPKDEGSPWYAGKPKTALEHLGLVKQGIVVLHHGLLAYPQWPIWNEIVGIQDRKFGYHIGQSVRAEVRDPQHPITRGIAPWEMVDETYTMADAREGSEVLLTIAHPKSMRTIAWTRQHRNSRVFCFQCGHDNATWPNPSFREVLRRGILWAAGRI